MRLFLFFASLSFSFFSLADAPEFIPSNKFRAPNDVCASGPPIIPTPEQKKGRDKYCNNQFFRVRSELDMGHPGISLPCACHEVEWQLPGGFRRDYSLLRWEDETLVVKDKFSQYPISKPEHTPSSEDFSHTLCQPKAELGSRVTILSARSYNGGHLIHQKLTCRIGHNSRGRVTRVGFDQVDVEADGCLGERIKLRFHLLEREGQWPDRDNSNQHKLIWPDQFRLYKSGDFYLELNENNCTPVFDQRN